MGHSVHCSNMNLYQNLLRPARTLSCHFPKLRSMIRRIYEIRRFVCHNEAVKLAQSEGNFEDFKAAISTLEDIYSKLNTILPRHQMTVAIMTHMTIASRMKKL